MHRGVVHAEHRILQGLTVLEVFNNHAVVPSLRSVDAERVGLVDLVVGEVIRGCLGLSCSIGSADEHVYLKPFRHEPPGEFLGGLALLNERRAVLLEDRDPRAEQ